MVDIDTSRTYRRQIRLESNAPGVVLAALEDPAHHVRVTLTFADDVVRSVTGEVVRLPWSTCPGAAEGLRSLVGAPLTTSLRSLRSLYEPSLHCTHFFDLTQLALAHAAARRTERWYEVISWTTGPTKHARLRRDGHLVFDWTIEDGRINQPEAFAGVELGQGFLRWCTDNLDDDTAEAAFVLRRAASMSMIAGLPMDSFAVAADSGLQPGVCFTAQPQRIQIATRHVGSMRDYSESSDGMLHGFGSAGRGDHESGGD